MLSACSPEASPDHHYDQCCGRVADHSRRIARSSSGHTARGRGFRTYLVQGSFDDQPFVGPGRSYEADDYLNARRRFHPGLQRRDQRWIRTGRKLPASATVPQPGRHGLVRVLFAVFGLAYSCRDGVAGQPCGPRHHSRASVAAYCRLEGSCNTASEDRNFARNHERGRGRSHRGGLQDRALRFSQTG
jgi:hypothetical protein